ncbi:hypothetical protein RLT57_02325 [Streptomyces sp. ITFR-21]|nr:hypothetical protein [Streptomyces sp. ITFR-21]WNI14491.1 hypothetical protein RLT57_02325 [Streptomyces sp. ITFR-21]
MTASRVTASGAARTALTSATGMSSAWKQRMIPAVRTCEVS